MVEPYPGYGAVREARSRDLIQTSGSYRTPSCYEMGAMDVVGPKLPSWNVRYSVAIGGKADMTRAPLDGRS